MIDPFAQSIIKPNRLDSPSIQTTRETVETLKELLHFSVLVDFSEACSEYQEIVQHRIRYYLKSAPHLLAEEEMAIEKSVDLRSRIYCIRSANRVLASVRLTPRPFEFEQFGLQQLQNMNFSNYWELGRLVSEVDLEPMASALVVRFLLCATGLDAVEQVKCQGLVAICRPTRLSFFEKFGLESHFEFFSERRGIGYCFLSAPMQRVLDHATKVQVSEKSVRMRLARLSQVRFEDAKVD